jgi:signal transduction histidine kinase
MYIHDGTCSVFVHSQSSATLEVGDTVDVTGFAVSGVYKPVLEDAEVRRIGGGAAPEAIPISPEHVLSGRFDANLVKLDARLLESVRGRDEQQLLMRAGPYLFTAILRGATVPEIRPGSELRLSGICALGAMERSGQQTFRMLLRTPRDVEVLRRAPWWNPEHAAWVLVAMAAGIALALAWVTTLRRQVQEQSAVIWERVKRETELQERHRMARELHDTLEQNLAGIGLCLEAATRALPGRSKVAEQHLALAVEQVNAGIDEVRRSVWALRTQSLDTSGLAAALDEMGQQLARCSATSIEVRTRAFGTPRPFAVAVENDLLRIGQEALTNAVRHGRAPHIEVELHYGPDAFRLRVSDDGRGFDSSVPPRPGHFGLVGMRERAEAIGARLDVRSGMNRGTDVEVTVPVQSHRLREVG